jgi:ankyrin repeat protein
VQDNFQSTPLHYAASVGNLETVVLLLEYGNSATYMPDKNGLYPIHLAAKFGRTSVIKELMEALPDSDELLDKEGRNFLHIAIENGLDDIIPHFCQKHMLLNARDYKGNTPLHLASKNGYLKSVMSLISFNKVCPSIMNNMGLTPLDLAMREAHPGFMHRLVRIINLYFISVYSF